MLRGCGGGGEREAAEATYCYKWMCGVVVVVNEKYKHRA
jgi:hypothetical protein